MMTVAIMMMKFNQGSGFVYENFPSSAFAKFVLISAHM